MCLSNNSFSFDAVSKGKQSNFISVAVNDTFSYCIMGIFKHDQTCEHNLWPNIYRNVILESGPRNEKLPCCHSVMNQLKY